MIIYSQGPNWRDEVSLHDQPSIPEHAVYGQQHQHLIVLAGPFTDGSGGAVVIDVESEQEARAFVDQDPAVLSGVFSYQIKQWSTVISRFEGNQFNFDEQYLAYKHKVQKDLGII
jgi:hypothetical protein